MPKLDASTAATKWRDRTSAAASDYQRGVETTSKDPTALAIQAGPRYIQGVQEAFNSGKWANGLRRTGVQGWRNAVLSKGVTNFGTGVMAAQDKVASAFGPLFAFMGNLESQIASMPNVSAADREARMLAWVRGMRTYQRPS